MTDASADLQRLLLRRVLKARDAGRLHLWFDGAVIDRYHDQPGAQLMRTRTVGRVAIAGRWSLDVGLAEDGPQGVLLHLPVQDLLDRLPESEWEHWVSHLVTPSASERFLQMRLSPGACIDDGEPQQW